MLISPGLEQAFALAEQAVELLTAAAQGGYVFDDGTALLAAEPRLRALEERFQAARLAMLPKIETSGAWRLDYLSVGKFNTWLAQHDDIARSTANWEVRKALQLRDDLPETLSRALSGEATASQVHALCTVGATSTERIAALRNPVSGWEGAGNSLKDDSPENAASLEAAGDPEYAADLAADSDEDSQSAQPESTETGIAGSPPTGEEFLLDMAAVVPLYQFNKLVRRFAHVSDPESDERGYKAARDREYFEISPTLGGYHLAGFLTEEHGQQVKIAIDHLVNATLTANGDIVAARAERTDNQRRAQGLADLAKLALDTGMLGAGAIERTQMTVQLSWNEYQTLQNEPHACHLICHDTTSRSSHTSRTGGDSGLGGYSGVTGDSGVAGSAFSRHLEAKSFGDCPPPCGGAASLADPAYPKPKFGPQLDISSLTDPTLDYATYGDGSGPIPRGVLKRLACDCTIRRIIFGPDSQILDVGRSQRTVPPHIRTAVIARDKHCVYPNCDQPPQRCEVHHAVTHSHPTDLRSKSSRTPRLGRRWRL